MAFSPHVARLCPSRTGQGKGLFLLRAHKYGNAGGLCSVKTGNKNKTYHEDFLLLLLKSKKRYISFK